MVAFKTDIDSVISNPGDWEDAQYLENNVEKNNIILSEFQDQYLRFENLNVDLLKIYDISSLSFELIYDFLQHVDDLIGIQQLDTIMVYEGKSLQYFNALYRNLFINIQRYILEIEKLSEKKAFKLLVLPVNVIREKLIAYFQEKSDRYSELLGRNIEINGPIIVQNKLLEMQIVINTLDNDITKYVNDVLYKM